MASTPPSDQISEAEKERLRDLLQDVKVEARDALKIEEQQEIKKLLKQFASVTGVDVGRLDDLR
jgi:hypothetical protein